MSEGNTINTKKRSRGNTQDPGEGNTLNTNEEIVYLFSDDECSEPETIINNPIQPDNLYNRRRYPLALRERDIVDLDEDKLRELCKLILLKYENLEWRCQIVKRK